MRLRVKIPRKTSRKRLSKEGVEYVHTLPDGGYEEFIFKDTSVANVSRVLSALFLPVDNQELRSRSRGILSEGTITGPTSTYFYKSGGGILPDLADKIRKEFKETDFALVDPLSPLGSACYLYTLVSDEANICIGSGSGLVFSDRETYSIEDFNEYSDEDLHVSFQYFNTRDQDFKRLEREFKSKMFRSVKKERKREVMFEQCNIVPETIAVSFCAPILQSASLSSSIFNRLLNKTTAYKFRGFTKLSSKDKSDNVRDRLVNMYNACVPQMQANFDAYCGGIENWDHDPQNYTYDHACNHKTQMCNPLMGQAWTAPPHKAGISFSAVYYAHNILEKYLLSLDPLPIEIDKSTPTDYAGYTKNILYLYMYDRFIREHIGVRDSYVHSYVSRTGKSVSEETINFESTALRIPVELHKLLIKNMSTVTAETPLVKPSTKKQTKPRVRTVPVFTTSSEEDVLIKEFEASMGDIKELNKTLDKLLAAV
tara:strand:- start:183740 stop:185188 length:1449 start_codon:yes stop_codon:yes gene_type:complete